MTGPLDFLRGLAASASQEHSWAVGTAAGAALFFAVNAYQAARSRAKRLHWIWDDGRSPMRQRIDVDDLAFPPGFVWGTATAAHQVEGNCTNNNWARWESYRHADGRPGIKRNQKAGVACDHWNRIDEDIEHMKTLGVTAYRFSIEWSKLEPSPGEWNTDVERHYLEVLRKLRAANMEPFVTLYHFSHPIWFDDMGAFERITNLPLFVAFCVRAFQAFGNQVRFWCTINEPEVLASTSYFRGDFPPGKQDWQLAGEVLKNLCEAHVQVYHALKALPGGDEAQIGIVKNIFQFEPYRDWHPLERLVASMIDKAFNESVLNFFVSGVFRCRLGLASVTHVNAKAKRSNDFLGVNYYSHHQVRFKFDLKDPFDFVHHPRDLMTDMDYPLYPEGIYLAIKSAARVGVPIYVTENGVADAADDRRGLFIRRYLYAVSQAIREGVDVRGYFFWSLMDNFEWCEGYDMKFGLYEVDFATQKRTMRPSARYFQTIVRRFGGQTTSKH